MGYIIDLKFITNWICSACLNEIFPFQICLIDDLIENKYQDNMETQFDINKICNEYNFFHTLNESEEDGKLEIDFCQVHCDYYDINKFQNIWVTNLNGLPQLA